MKNIKKIKIADRQLLEKMFLGQDKVLKPRHQRDIGRIISLLKALALLNLWFRERDGNTITANEYDIRQAFKIWDGISESQELNLPPYVYNLYRDVVIPLFKEKNSELEGGVYNYPTPQLTIVSELLSLFGFVFP